MANEKYWQYVAVLGAAGKMGSGISLLLLQEMADIDGSQLTLLDTNKSGFAPLRKYLREHLCKHAERNINRLRGKYDGRPELIDNGDIIEEFVTQAMDRVRCVASLEECQGANMVFEAIIEDVEIKSEIFRNLDHITGRAAYFFTNTSSIPIALLDQKSNLKGRLIGFHFYNPPAVQKLLEIIAPENVDPGLRELAVQLAARLKKTIVFSNDVAGFIGNGHFIREILGACSKVRELSPRLSQIGSIAAINRVTQEFMLRPMGIFQLIDYVGIDVCRHIGKIMTTYLPAGSFIDPLVEAMVSEGILGGQNADGSQKDGFFRYEKGHPAAIYDLAKKSYVTYRDDLGKLPPNHFPWKALSKDPKRQEKIELYFSSLKQEHSLGSELCLDFLKQSQAIAHGLVKDGVARSIEDVDTVLQQGFFHLYSVDAPFLSLVKPGGQR